MTSCHAIVQHTFTDTKDALPPESTQKTLQTNTGRPQHSEQCQHAWLVEVTLIFSAPLHQALSLTQLLSQVHQKPVQLPKHIVPQLRQLLPESAKQLWHASHWP